MYTMHSPGQGYSNTSADMYSTRAYGGHLMAQNYSYLTREEPYNGTNATAHYQNGPPMQSTHYVASSSMPQHTYPTLPPISHFPHQQDLYSSCVASSRNHSYPSTGVTSSAISRHALSSKNFWNCDSMPLQQQQQQHQQQQQSNHCYSLVNNSINSSHKSSPQAWSHSPNVMSSPSSTPSPIPCPSTPHHFASSPHPSSQAHTDGHKNYNGIGAINNSSQPSNGNATATNLSCSGINPLQSLQKMVQIESESNEIRVQYDNAVPSTSLGGVGQLQSTQASGAPPLGSIDAETGYPTYYNLDQNRLCATPQSAYPNISTQAQLSTVPFSATLKNSQEIRPPALQSGNVRSKQQQQENGSENGELARPNSMRFARKLAKEGNFMSSSRSCSTDTCSASGSPTAQSNAQVSGNKIAPIPAESAVVIQAEAAHPDSVNSFRGSVETTANSRDSIKSTDSDAMSSYAVSQCPTPGSGSWKQHNTATAVNQPNDFQRQTSTNNYVSSTQQSGKAWWPETAISPPSSSRSFMPHVNTESAQYDKNGINYSSTASATHSIPQGNSSATSSSSLPPNQTWPQQSPTPSAATSSGTQIMSAIASFQAEGVVVKKKRGRPFGSKNRRSLEATAQNAVVPNLVPIDANKRKRKSVLIDIGVNTNLSFDVQASLNIEDSCAFAPESTVKHSLPLAVRRKKVVGPVVRIDKSGHTTLSAQTKYSIVNGSGKNGNGGCSAVVEEEKDVKLKVQTTKSSGLDLSNHSRKNGQTKRSHNVGSSMHCSSNNEKGWICILCHKGPHYKGLGDLYGPYMIFLDKSKLPSSTDIDLTNQHLPSHHHENRQQEESETIEHASTERRSLRRRADPAANEENKSRANTSDEKKDSKVNLEVWVHEDCIVWSNNVYLDGPKIRNLEPAIVESFSNICTKCKLPGATLGCIFKNCNVSPLHYLCAKDKDCDLDEEKFILSCSKHKKRRISPKELLDVVEVSEATTTGTNDT